MKKIRDIWMMLLVMCMVVTMIPIDAFASDEIIEPEETTVSEVTDDESEDPGRDRYTGNISEDFYEMDSPIQLRAISHNNRFDGYTIEKGIDVSKWQETIDWKKVAASGVDFAIIRVGYRSLSKSGTLNEDPYFRKNIEGALANGIKVGVYMFSQAITEKEAIAEADYLLKRVKGYKIELPLVMDYEYGGSSNPGRLYNAKLTKRKATNNCLAFCKRVEEAGYPAMVYANKTFLRDKVYVDEISEKYEIWLAHYTNATDSTADYTYWQYSSSGTVNGINGNVDMNFHYVNDKNIRRPVVEIAERRTTSVTLEWSKDGNASGYEIYASKSGGSYALVGTVDENTLTFTHAELSKGTSYKYKVRAIYNNTDGTKEYGSYSSVKEAVTTIDYKTQITDTSSTFDTVTLKWKKVDEDIMGYKIYYYNTSNKKHTLVKTISNPEVLSYTHTGRNSETTYQYKIRPYNIINGTTIWGNFSDVVKVTTSEPVKGIVTGNKVNIRKGAGTSYAKITSVKKGTILTFVGSTSQWYKVSLTVNGKKTTGYITKDLTKVVSVPKKPTLKAKSSSYDKVMLTWDKVSGASGYQIQRYNAVDKKYETIKTITNGSTTSFSNGYRNCNTTYKYRIRAYKTYSGTKVYGSYSSAVSATTTEAIKGTTTAAVKVRKSTSTTSAVWTTVKKNKTVKITGKRDGWYRVSVTVSGQIKTGYISSKYITL